MAPIPDDERAAHAGRYILMGLASHLLIALFVGALALPPLFIFAAYRRGQGPLGTAILLGYLLFLALVARKLFGGRRSRNHGQTGTGTRRD
jgi:hypothetical protein